MTRQKRIFMSFHALRSYARRHARCQFYPVVFPNMPKDMPCHPATHMCMCTASLEERVPPWLRGRGQGWVTAEYGMLPRHGRAHAPRSQRWQAIGPHAGNSSLIGRSLRAVADMKVLAKTRSTLTAMSFRPMAAPAPLRLRVPGLPCMIALRGCAHAGWCPARY